jgi:hypothetical protein
MRRRIFGTLLGISMTASTAFGQTATTPPAEKPMTINQRLENQHERIVNGTKDDLLTQRERTTLRADEAAIRAQERVYRQAHDGKLTKSERKQLTHELNRTSRQIARDRHNNRKPKSQYRRARRAAGIPAATARRGADQAPS